MIITRLEQLGKNKVKVYIDEEYHFLLYQKDIKVYHLQENEEISNILYQDILTNTVLRRGKQKALAILKYMDRTEQELKNKLKQADYTDRLIDDIIKYVKAYHYIDDSRYACDYVRNRMNSKSKKQLQFELLQKGIDKGMIDKAIISEYEGEGEDISIKKAIAKKQKNIDDMTKEEKLKLSAYLYRKGYTVDLINKYLNCN